MKFLVIKSYSGFGDRIEHVLACLQYVAKTDRCLVIDWTDHVWCGDEIKKGFDYYFMIKGVKYMLLEDFKKAYVYYKLNKVKMSVVPNFFEHIMLRRSNECDIPYKFSDINDLFKAVVSGDRKDLDYDIIVTTDLDARNTSGIYSIESLIFKENVMNFIKQDKNYDFLMNNKFVSIHLRGSDRSKYTEENRPDLTNYSHHTEEYINNLIVKIPEDTRNLLVLTDSVILYEAFMNKIDKKYNIIDTNNQRTSGNVGLHLEKEKSKESKNLELLKDFYFMSKSSFVVCDEISRFSLVAKRISFICK